MSEAADNVWNQRILEHESWLRTVVRSRLSRPDEVEDVLQSVLSDALAFSNRSAEVQSMGPWLYRMAVNGVLQFRRKCGRRRKLHQGYADTAETTESVEPLDLVIGDERRRLVQRTLENMTGEDAEILLLKYVHGWSYEDISQRLGLDGYRVAHRLRRARSRLRRQLRALGLAPNEGEEQ